MTKNDIVKIRFIESGFLPDYPYHLISDREMVNAFLNSSEDDYFHVMYPLVDKDLDIEYDNLVSGIQKELDKYLDSIKTQGSYMLPDWIYSYMIGAVVGPNSSQLDKHDLFTMLNVDNIDDVFTKECGAACYKASVTWLNKYAYREINADTRPATIFGEPHVIKYLRLQQADALRGDDVV